jgi:type I restriction enzyme S subunit
MTNWKEYKLGEIAEVQNGYAFKSIDFAESGTPIIKIKNVVPPAVQLNDCVYYKGSLDGQLEKFVVRKNDFLISMTGSTVNQMASAVGKMGKYPFDEIALLNQRVGKIYSISDKISDKYLYYLLNRFEVQYDLALNASGSANQANISPTQIKNIKLRIPDLPTQTAIAEILSSLDDKIELNNKINSSLENLAQTLFKQWFIDFEFPNENGEPYKSSGGVMVESELGEIPKGWEVKNLSEVTEISSSKRIFSKEYIEKGIPFFRGKEITELDNSNKISTELFISNERYTEIKSKFGVPKIGDILITSVGTIGNTYLINYEFDFYFKDGNITWIKNYISHLSPYFIFTWLRSYETQSNIKKVCIGSTQQALTITALNNLKIIFPITVLASEFSSVVESLYNQISSNKNENQELTNLRDTLLPKLISGELEVNEEIYKIENYNA